MSLYTMAFMITPFGALLAGASVEHFGIQSTLFVCGLVTLAAGLYFGTQLKSLQAEARATYVERGILAPEEPPFED